MLVYKKNTLCNETKVFFCYFDIVSVQKKYTLYVYVTKVIFVILL